MLTVLPLLDPQLAINTEDWRNTQFSIFNTILEAITILVQSENPFQYPSPGISD